MNLQRGKPNIEWITRVPWTYPHNQALLTFRIITADRFSSGKKLKEDDPKCIDINLLIYFAIHKVFRSHVTAEKIFVLKILMFPKHSRSKFKMPRPIVVLKNDKNVGHRSYSYWRRSTNPKVPATSEQVMCDDEVEAHLARPKSESCTEKRQDIGRYINITVTLKT